MSENASEQDERVVARLGGQADERIHRYFCVDDEQCHAFAHVSKDAKVVKRTPVTVKVPDGTVEGWILEVSVPATDGTVRIDPFADTTTFTG